MIIYKTTNKINGKIYIGQDSKNKKNYFGSGKLILKAFKKYGKENFTKEILCECRTKKELDKKEQFWIKKLNSLVPVGYNLAEGGGGSLGYKHTKIAKMKISKNNARNMLGKHHSNKTKTQISDTVKELWNDKEYREFHTNVNLGKKHSDETKEKHRQIMLTIGQTKEYKEKMSISLKKRYKLNPMSDETKEKIRQSNIGTKRPPCPEWKKEYLRNKYKGRKFSNEWRLKLSNSAKNRGKANRLLKENPNLTKQQALDLVKSELEK